MKEKEKSMEDLKAICGDMYGDLHVEDVDMTSSHDDQDATIPAKELFKVSRSCRISRVMGTQMVSCGPDEMIKDMVDLFADRSGLPVIDENRVVVGMITRKVSAFCLVLFPT